ncbi:outer membrane murein-binding lipoprotein Lpp [Nocardiopsis mwathae]|uniref:Outer membrane murein-binding lipoprotein Lpp n=1 Tax=Nocardiopsis mwathae TaxID=1472723 RepID=A0A7W9YN49_9ACTN|nr:outer membrane murein-binding lipoprotein Lpp [Nocardiopsis mwathae]
MRSVLVYTASRLLLFAVALGVLYLLGARDFLALALAFLISGLVSYVLLSQQRDAMSTVVADGLAKMRGMGDRLEEGASKEDAAQRAAAAAATESAEPAADASADTKADDATSATTAADRTH